MVGATMKIAILVPFGIIFGLIFLLAVVPDYVPNDIILLLEFLILFSVIAYVASGIIR